MMRSSNLLLVVALATTTRLCLAATAADEIADHGGASFLRGLKEEDDVNDEQRMLGKKNDNGGGGGGNGKPGQEPTTPSPTKSPSTVTTTTTTTPATTTTTTATTAACAQKDQSCKSISCCNPLELECTGKGKDKKCTEIPAPPPTNDCYNRDAGIAGNCNNAERIDCTLTEKPPMSQISGYSSDYYVFECDTWATIGCCHDGVGGYYKIDYCYLGLMACCPEGQADTNAGCVTLTKN